MILRSAMNRLTRALTVLAVLAGIGATERVVAQPVLVVHLPSTPIEAAGRQVAAITALADDIAASTEGLELETKVFRRVSDIRRFLAAEGDRVVLLLADSSFLIGLPEADEWRSMGRARRDGKPTYRRLLVVQAGREDLSSLPDMRGSSLSVVETTGEGQLDYVARAIFDNALDPATWFGAVDRVVDDFSGMVNVLYGETDAALVSEHNPLLQARLDKDLRVLYTSPPLSLPVLWRRLGRLSSEQATALGETLRGIADEPSGRETLAALGFDSFETWSHEDAASVSAVSGSDEKRSKQYEVALPEAGAVALETPAAPDADQLQLILSIELPEIPLTAFEPLEQP